MNKSILYLITIVLFSLTSCEDFLQRDPKDFGSEAQYFKTVEDLQNAANMLYPLFPGHGSESNFLYQIDTNSDDMTGGGANSNFIAGERLPQPTDDNNDWKFTNIRTCNYFIALTEKRMANNEISGSESLKNHALGEFYFFRAYDHFRLLRVYGDAPILDKEQPDNFLELRQSSARKPRNEVARFIISDLEMARDLMQEASPALGRVNKDCASLMLARVALFEATWEKYHAGTTFVPGNAKWLGKTMYPNFKFVSGSSEAEIIFFLDKAIESSNFVAQKRRLATDYESLFSSTNTEKYPEMILAKKYMTGVAVHSVGRHLLAGSTGVGFTQAVMDSYLMINGLPIYADPLFYADKQDTSLVVEVKNRDRRMIQSVQWPGAPANADPVKPSFFETPAILGQVDTYCPTGYSVRKYHLEDPAQNNALKISTSDSPIFRASEAYLIYLEAYYERFGKVDPLGDAYWKELRNRAGVSTDYQATIAATVLSKENDLAVWSKGVEVSPTLYNIRRERRCELIAEGFRLDDLRRWRSLDMMNAAGNKNVLDGVSEGYIMSGINLWEQFWTRYDEKTLTAAEAVSSRADGDRIYPQRRYKSSKAFEGYNFPKPHYLEPVPVSEILLCSPSNGDRSQSTIYQNPGWSNEINAPADANYDCN